MSPQKGKDLVGFMKTCAEKRSEITKRVGYLADAIEASSNGDNTKILYPSHIRRLGKPHDGCPNLAKE